MPLPWRQAEADDGSGRKWLGADVGRVLQSLASRQPRHRRSPRRHRPSRAGMEDPLDQNPLPIGSRFADTVERTTRCHHDRHRPRGIAIVEQRPAPAGDPGSEISRRDDLDPSDDFVRLLRHAERHPSPHPRSGSRWPRRLLHAWHRAHLVEHLPDVCVNATVRDRSFGSGRYAATMPPCRAVSTSITVEAADQQPGAGEQDERGVTAPRRRWRT